MGTDAGAGQIATAVQNSYPSWEYDVLRMLGAPQGEPQLRILNVIAGHEGMPSDTNNWLAITESTPNEWGPIGASDKSVASRSLSNGIWNSDNVVTYRTQSQGVQALVDFLQHGHTGIVTALRNPDATNESIAQAIIADGAWSGDDNALEAGANLPITAPVYTGGASTGDKSTEDSKITFTNCGDRKGGIKLGPWTLFNSCELKALTGGLLVGLGGVVVVAGIYLIVGDVQKNGTVKQSAARLRQGGAKLQRLVLRT